MSDELSPYEVRLGEAMEPVVEFAAFELNRESAEGAALAPLGQFPRAAEQIAFWLSDVDHGYIRCVGALIPGYTPDCDPELLQELWRRETERRGNGGRLLDAEEDDAEEDEDGEFSAELVIAETNSVAERILMSCIRWLRRDEAEQRAAAEGILVDMVERTIGGEVWNDAHWALSALCRADCAVAAALVERFGAGTTGADYPEYFPRWAERLRQGDPEALAAGDQLVEGADEAAGEVKIPKGRKKELEALLEAARAMEESVEE